MKHKSFPQYNAQCYNSSPTFKVISLLSYDPQSNSLSSEDANGDVTVFIFGEDFGVRTFEDSGGNVYGFEEDNEQRISRLVFPDSSNIQLSYVGNGSQLLSEVVRRSGARVEYIYDSNDNLVSVCSLVCMLLQKYKVKQLVFLLLVLGLLHVVYVCYEVVLHKRA